MSARDLPPSDFAGLELQAARDTRVSRYEQQDHQIAVGATSLASRLFVIALALSSPAAIALGFYLANR